MVEIEIIPCGTTVCSKLNNEVIGIITCAYVRFASVSYEISYFVGQTYTTIILNETEFLISDDVKPKKVRIKGFKNNKHE